MSKASSHHCNLNIWYYLPEGEWSKVSSLYERMPGWVGFENGIPYWFGKEDDDFFITASIEPSGLSFDAQLDNSDWISWITTFKTEATKILGYDVGEPEDGFE